jgi:glyoxylase-like metal-dependent hydrolase (beta-lactamase superfamily II)
VADGIWSIRMPLGAPDNPSVLCYVVLDSAGESHLIDSGVASEPGALAAGLGTLGLALGDLRTVTLTHLHGDHTGLADAVRSVGGATVAIHARDADANERLGSISREQLTQWGVPDDEADALGGFTQPRFAIPAPDRLLQDGDPLGIPGRDLRVVHTPGHTDGHACFFSERERILFTGDHLLPDQFAGVGLGAPSLGNPLADYRASLERIRAFDGSLALPGHGWPFDRIAERIDETLAHHGRRTTEVAAVLARDPGASVWEIAEQLTWTRGWDALAGFYRLSALRQTAWHRDLVLAS